MGDKKESPELKAVNPVPADKSL